MKSLKTKKLNRVLTLVLTFMALMAGQTAWAENGWDIQASSSGTTTTFTISRTNTAVAETVKYRFVNLSTFAGQHYNVTQVNGTDKTTEAQQTAALSGDLVFSAGDKSKTVQVRESAGNNAYAYYKDDTERSYKLEVTDIGGFYLTSNTRSFTKGTSIKSDNVYAEKSVTVKSGETKVTDDNYKQAYHAVTVDNYYTAAAPKAYLEAAGAELRMTLGFQAKEGDDGYQHVQILVNQTSNHDEGAGNNNPGTMNYSSYMACFCHEGGTKNTTYSNYIFPDVSHGHDCGNVGKVWSSINSTNDVGELRQQYFNSNCRASDGRLIIASKSGLISFSTLGIRFDASGDNEDTWYAKDVKAYIQAVDVTAPTMLANSITVAPGRHSKGNTVYVSVAFNEIVKVTGTPKLTTTSNNNWGDLSYVAGDGTNVLTFSTTIPANASGNLNITSLSGTVKDLAGNSLTGSGVTASGLCSVDASFAYTITYNLGEGVLPDGYPTTYTYDAAVTLTNPTKTGYWFNGWTGSNGNTPNTTVTIVKNSHGNKSYTANWTDVWGVESEHDGTTAKKAYTITTTQGLDLLAALVNNGDLKNFEGKFFKLGDDITYTHGNSNTENNYTAIGGYYNGGWKYFCGTFDGQGKTVRGIRIYKAGTTNADDNVGLFGITSGATIKNVILADARITGRQCVGGIAGYIEMNGDNGGMCENCRVGSDVTIHAVADYAKYHGGVVGDCNGGTISGCVSTATLTMANGLTGINTYGGIVGSLSGNMSNCLALNATVPAVLNNGAIAGYVDGTHTNNYHHGCTVGGNAAPSNANNASAYTISAGTNVTVAPAGDAAQTYEYKGIQRYGNALYYGGKFYAPEAADVSLTLDYPVPAGLTLDYTATAGTLNLTPNPSPSGEGSYTLTVPAEDVTINASLSAKYIAADGTEQTCSDCTLVESSTGSTVMLGTDGEEHWFVVSGDVSITNTDDAALSFNGAARLILCDGASLTLSGNWPLTVNGNLVIYGQSQGTGSLAAEGSAAIKVYEASTAVADNGTLTINGGSIHSTGNNGINVVNSITINGGTVSATSDNLYGNGILSNNGDVTVNGGIVSAIGGNRGIGIQASGTITLGWTSPTDHIYASSYSNDPTVKDGQALTDGTTAYSGTVSISDINGKTLWPDLWNVAGGNDGSSAAKAYTITTTGGLDLLATLVNSGNDFKDNFFRLGNDITYSHKADNEEGADTENNYIAIGTNETPFCGTFDGQGKKVSGIRIYKGKVRYQGLFGMAVGATIKNVSLADARITGGQFVGGIAGHLDGTVENCRVGSDVIIHAVTNSAIMHGGVVGLVYDGNISGCVSAATLTVANNLTGTNSYGGIVGVLAGNMSDCLALGASVPNVTGQGAIIGNFASQGTKRPSSTNNYHHGCTVDGNAAPNNKRNVSAYTISAGTNVTVAPAGDADLTFPYEGIQRYGDALYYNGVLYVPTTAAGNDFSLTLGNTGTPATGFVFNGYTATAGTLNLTPDPSPSGEGSYTLTMPAEDVTINAKLKVSYIDENGEEKWCGDYTLIDGSTTTFGIDGGGDWYVVSGNVTFESSLQFKDGIAHLIICDGATLTVKACDSEAIKCNYALAIYGQADGTGIIDITNTKASGDGIYAQNNLTINGCHITCNTEERYGTGIYSDGYNLTINRGTITTKGYDGIYAFSNLIINGGTINATGSHRGLAGYHFFFNGGNVTATGGSGYERAGIYFQEDITLGWSSPDDRIYASSYAIGNDEHAMAVKVKDGQALYAGYMSADGVTISKFTGTIYDNNGGNPTGDLSVLAGKTLEPGIPFYIDGTAILLDDDSAQLDGYKNVDRIAALADNQSHNIMLYGRTLYRDGDWNTLCLPFGLNNEAVGNFLNYPTIMYMDLNDIYDHRCGEVDADGNLHLYFQYDICIIAGDPYIVKWDKPAGYDTNHAAYDIVNPIFEGVTIDDNAITPDFYATSEGPGNVTFRGTYSPIKYESDNHSILFLGAENTLYWPKEGAHIGAFRAYFELGNGITVGEEASTVRSFNLGFGEGSDETGIDSMHNSECLMLNEADAWYSLDGRKLDGKPSAKGLYIYKGKMVVVK